MAATKTTIGIGAQYHLTDSVGNHLVIKQGPVRPGAVQTLVMSVGGSMLELSQQNTVDLVAVFTTFANTGQVS
jgi:hypothetical protein